MISRISDSGGLTFALFYLRFTPYSSPRFFVLTLYFSPLSLTVLNFAAIISPYAGPQRFYPCTNSFFRFSTLQQYLQIIRMDRAHLCLFPLNIAIPNQRHQRLLKRERSFLLRQRYLLLQMLQGIPPDVVPRPITHHQQLRRGHAPAI